MIQARGVLPEDGSFGDWWLHRKDFMSKLGSALVQQVLATANDKSLLLDLVRVAADLIQEKHVLIYLKQAAVAGMLADLGWDGVLRPGSGDALLVIDTNMGFNKVDPRIERQIQYRIDLSDPTMPVATLDLHYAHTVREKIPCIHEATYGMGRTPIHSNAAIGTTSGCSSPADRS